MLERNVYPQRDHQECGVFLHEKEQHDHDHKGAPSPQGHEIESEKRERDFEAVWVEVLEVEPSQRRTHQESKRRQQSQPRVVEDTARDQVDGYSGHRQRQSLPKEKELDVGPDPVQRNKKKQDVGCVVSEQVQAHDGDERVLEAAEQPYPLVEDPDVEAGLLEGVVVVEREPPKIVCV